MEGLVRYGTFRQVKRWFTLVILATWEVEIGRIVI
jgi:hypothetical protein